jgi:hypothetical protein
MTSKNSSKHSLPGVENQFASGVTTPEVLETEKRLHDHGQSDEETGIEKDHNLPVVSEEYPTGKRLAFILVSLIFAVFLVSLDMVSHWSIRHWQGT